MEDPRPRRSSHRPPTPASEAEASRSAGAHHPPRGERRPKLLMGLLGWALLGGGALVLYPSFTSGAEPAHGEKDLSRPKHPKAASAPRAEQKPAAAKPEPVPPAPDNAASGAPEATQAVPSDSARQAEAFYQSAQKAKRQRRWASAVEYARLALQAVPGHAGATGLIAELREKAQQLYERHFVGYRQTDSNPEDAIPIYREIMDLTVPEDPLHQKAQVWLEKVAR